MFKRLILVCVWILSLSLAHAHAQSNNSIATIPAEAFREKNLSLEVQRLVTHYINQRKQLVETKSQTLPQLSQAINLALNDAIALSNQRQMQQAKARIEQLNSFMPIQDIPSYDLQNFLAYVYSQLKQTAEEQAQRDRSEALKELLLQHIGKGSLEDPLRLIMNSEIRDYARVFAGEPSSVRTEPRNGRELMVIGLKGLGPREVIVEIDPRVRAHINASNDRYQPIPTTQLRPEDQAWIDRARVARDQFFADSSFKYQELAKLVGDQHKAAEALARQGRDAEALKQLLEVQRIRAIEQIPTPRLLSLYSYLLGRTGNVEKQKELRGLIFGIQQVIGQSGDGSSPEKAIEVMMVDEEYDVLAVKKWRLVQQQLREIGGETFDVMTVENAQGQRSDVYFRITRMFRKYSM
jgi:Domain of unknown function (DUF4919)